MEPVAGRRRTRRHERDLPPGASGPQIDRSEELGGPRRTESPEAGVERLAAAAGNEAVAALLQRFRSGEDEEVDDGASGAGASGSIVEQAEQPPRQTEQAEQAGQSGGSGGDRFQIGQNVDWGSAAGAVGEAEQAGQSGGSGGDQFQIGQNVDGGSAAGAVAEAQQAGPQDAERQTQEQRAEVTAGQSVDAGGGAGGAFGDQLRQLTGLRLQGADQATRDLGNGLADAVATAWSSWQFLAVVSGVAVNGPTASGGQLTGPPLAPLIIANASAVDPVAGLALASALGAAHGQFTAAFFLQGLPVFPSFAAVPSPIAPPTPSIPIALAVGGLTPNAFGTASQAINLQDPAKQQAAVAVADAMAATVSTFIARSTLSMIGTGPVPTFAPPYVPVGPVVGGVANSTPGAIVG
jgi:hypothetical protein